MAQVTITGQPQRHIIGDLALRIFKVSGASGSTLPTGLRNILYVAIQQSTAAGSASLITSFSVSGGTITFTSSNTMASEVVAVYSREG